MILSLSGIEEGLPDDVVYNVLEDSNGFLWFRDQQKGWLNSILITAS